MASIYVDINTNLFTGPITRGQDNGKLASGILKSWAPTSDGRGYDNSCATTNDPKTTAYNLDLGLECVLIFKLKI